MATTAIKPLQVPKRLLFGPGPATVEPRAYAAMTQPVLGIRDPYFLELMAGVQDGLRSVFGTSNIRTFPVPSTGSGAMEAAVANFVEPGSKFAVFANGHFSDRISTMGARQRAHVVRLERPWGEVFTADEAEEFIARERPQVVAFVQAETSTGAYQTGEAIARAARAQGALVLADCVTSLGAMPVQVDKLGIDVAFSCSQKGLSCPSGLAPITISPRAWDWLQKRKDDPSTWYFDLRLMTKYFEPPNVYQHTPSPPLYYALHQGLAAVEEEGLEGRWERHRRTGNLLGAGIEKLGFTIAVARPEDRLYHLFAATPPSGIDEAQLRTKLVAEHGIEIAAGLGQWSGKVVRIGAMGPLATESNVQHLLQALAACV